MSVAGLSPQSTSFTQVTAERRFDPGTILIVPNSALASVETLKTIWGAWRTNPWCVIAITGAQEKGKEAVSTLLPDGLRAIVLPNVLIEPREIRRKIAESGVSSTDQNRFIELRLGRPAAEAIRLAIDSDPTVSGVRRSLTKLSLPPRGYWLKLFETTELITGAAWRSQSEAATASTAKLAVKTISRRCSRYFGRSWKQLAESAVWEGLVEISLRKMGISKPT